MKKIHNKLVRDKIPDIIKQTGAQPKVKKLKTSEFKKLLRQKLIEEAQELSRAVNREELLNEVSDVFEVLDHIVKHHRLDKKEISLAKTSKKKSRGGFDKKLFLEYVEEST